MLVLRQCPPDFPNMPPPERFQVYSGELLLGTIRNVTVPGMGSMIGWRWTINFVTVHYAGIGDLGGTEPTKEDAMRRFRARWDQWLAFAGLAEADRAPETERDIGV